MPTSQNTPEAPATTPARKGVSHATLARRSSRVMIDIPVQVTGKTVSGSAFSEDTKTSVVNAHGALLILATTLDVNSTISVKNQKTNAKVGCRVIYQKEIQQGRAEMGIEFITANPTFWAITFPPTDWAARTDTKGPSPVK